MVYQRLACRSGCEIVLDEILLMLTFWQCSERLIKHKCNEVKTSRLNNLLQRQTDWLPSLSSTNKKLWKRHRKLLNQKARNSILPSFLLLPLSFTNISEIALITEQPCHGRVHLYCPQMPLSLSLSSCSETRLKSRCDGSFSVPAFLPANKLC